MSTNNDDDDDDGPHSHSSFASSLLGLIDLLVTASLFPTLFHTSWSASAESTQCTESVVSFGCSSLETPALGHSLPVQRRIRPCHAFCLNSFVMWWWPTIEHVLRFDTNHRTSNRVIPWNLWRLPVSTFQLWAPYLFMLLLFTFRCALSPMVRSDDYCLHGLRSSYRLCGRSLLRV